MARHILNWAVMRVLERIGEPAKAAVPLLIDALRDRLYFHLIPRALGAIGPAAKAAVPLLIEWLDAPLPNLSKEGVAHTRFQPD